MAAGAAAEAPVLGYIAVGLLAAALFCVFVGLRAGWEHTFGAIFTSLASVKIDLGWFGSVHPLGFLNDANRAVMNALARGISSTEHAMGYLFHGAAVIQGWIARELVGLARDTLAWADWLQHAHLPRWLKAAIYAAIPPALLLRLIRAAIAAELPKLTRTTIQRVGVSRKTLKALIAAALIAAGIPALPGLHLPRRIRKIEHDLTSLWTRMRQLRWLLAFTGAAALVGAGLRKLGLSWLRCGNVTKTGRAVCGLDTGLLNELLGDTLAIVGAVSVVEFAEGLLAIEDEALAVLGGLVREWPTG